MDEKEMNGTPADDGADLALDDSLELADDTGDGAGGADEEIEISEEPEAAADDGKDGEEDPGDDAEDDFDLEEALEAAFAEDGEDENGDETGGDTAGDEKPDEKSTAPEESDAEKNDADKATETEPAASEKSDGKVPEESEELKKLRADYKKLKRRSRDALKSLEIDAEDEASGLERLAREQSDMSEEEYRADLARRDAEEDKAEQKEREDAVKKLLDIRAAIEKKKAVDLAAIHEAYPTTKKYTKIDDIPNFERFKELRDSGNSVIEAFNAVNAQIVASDLGEIEHRRSLEASKSHLKSVAGKSAGGTVKIPASEYRMIKSLLGDDVSDTEIAKYYKKVKGK